MYLKEAQLLGAAVEDPWTTVQGCAVIIWASPKKDSRQQDGNVRWGQQGPCIVWILS